MPPGTQDIGYLRQSEVKALKSGFKTRMLEVCGTPRHQLHHRTAHITHLGQVLK